MWRTKRSPCHFAKEIDAHHVLPRKVSYVPYRSRASLGFQKSLSKTLPQVTESAYPRIVFHGFKNHQFIERFG